MKYIISAGGTGGHIYPALSIIKKIKELDKKSEILYIGTTDRMEKDIVPNQYHDLDEFLDAVELVVILVDHHEIKENMDKLKDKTIFDTRHVCSLEGAYHL